MKIGKWFWKKQHETDNEIIITNDIDKVLYSTDEWYIYYRQCTKNIRKIRSILEYFTNQPQGYSKTAKFWEGIVEIGFLADIKDPEEMKEWLLHCKKEVLTSKPKHQQTKAWSERKKVLYSWLKRAKAVGIAPLPSSRPSQGQRKEWEDSVVKAERISKTKNGKNPPYNSVKDGAYKWECIEKLKSLQVNDSLRIEDRIHQTVEWWVIGMENTMKEFKDKKFIVKEINHNTQIIWRAK